MRRLWGHTKALIDINVHFAQKWAKLHHGPMWTVASISDKLRYSSLFADLDLKITDSVQTVEMFQLHDCRGYSQYTLVNQDTEDEGHPGNIIIFNTTQEVHQYSTNVLYYLTNNTNTVILRSKTV